MNTTALLADLRNAGIAVQVHAGRLKLDAPRGALTETVLSAVRDSKVEFLKLLEPADVAPTPGVTLFSAGPGAGPSAATPTPARTAPVESIAQTTQLGDDSKVDREFDRFEQVAAPMADGSGWYDPTEEPVGVGVAIEDWRKFETDCAGLGRKKKNPKGGGIQIQRRIIGVTNRGETT